MARRTAQPPAEVPLYLNMPREEASRKIAERIKGGAELNRRPIRDPQTFQDAQRSCWTWGEYNEEMLRQMFTSPIIAEEYRRPSGSLLSLESCTSKRKSKLFTDRSTTRCVG